MYFANKVAKLGETDLTRTVREQFFFHASTPKVFNGLTVPRQITRWFFSKATIPHRKGATYRFTYPDGQEQSGKVLDYARDKRFSIEWPQYWRGRFLGMTKVTFTVEPKDKGTLLNVRHTGYKNGHAWLEKYAGTHAGWAYYLMNFKSVLEHGHDLRSKGDSEM